MRIDKDLLLTLKNDLSEKLPPRSFLKIDRGDSLFITNADISRAPGFVCERRGSMTVIRPSVDYIGMFENSCNPVSDLSESVKRYAGIPASPPAAALFTGGLKLLYNPTTSDVALYDKNVRRFIAEALRTRNYGGVFSLAVLADTLIIQHGGNKDGH